MAELCVFCGKKLPFFGRREILCCGILQPLCIECFPSISELSQEERSDRALNSGRAVDPAGLRKAMDTRKEFLLESEVRAKEWNQKKAELNSFTCLRCGQTMKRIGQTFVSTDRNLRISLEVVQCGYCGKTEFFSHDCLSFPEENSPTVTCPVCGFSHHPDVGCPRCAMRQVEGGQIRKADWEAAQKKSSSSKPPWEQ